MLSRMYYCLQTNVASHCIYLHVKEPRETEISTKQQTDVLKYGLQSPLHDYYHFNRSRQNSV